MISESGSVAYVMLIADPRNLLFAGKFVLERFVCECGWFQTIKESVF